HVARINVLFTDNASIRDEIVLINVIADGPDDACGCGLGPRLITELHRPFVAMDILDDDLFLSAALGTFHVCEGHRSVGRACAPARAVKQVAAFDVYGRLPQDCAIVGIRIGDEGDWLAVLRLAMLSDSLMRR